MIDKETLLVAKCGYVGLNVGIEIIASVDCTLSLILVQKVLHGGDGNILKINLFDDFVTRSGNKVLFLLHICNDHAIDDYVEDHGGSHE